MSVLTQAHELTLGSIAFDTDVQPYGQPWQYETMAAGASFGNPAQLVDVIDSALIDGALATVTGYGNREIRFRLRISAPDGNSLAQAEALLMREVRAARPSPLVWTPPAFDSWPAVFDVVSVNVERDFSDGWDLEEKLRAYRYYLVTITAGPWVHDPEPTVIPALGAPVDPETPPVYEVLDTCSSTSGWTARLCHADHFVPGSTSITTSSNAGGTYVYTTVINAAITKAIWVSTVKASANYNVSGWAYFTVDMALNGTPTAVRLVRSWTNGLGAEYVGEEEHAPEAVLTINGALGIKRYYFAVPAAAVTFPYVEVRAYWQPVGAQVRRNIVTYETGRADRIPTVTDSGKQVIRTALIGGSAPTAAAIRFFPSEPDAGGLIDSAALIYIGRVAPITLRELVKSSATVTPDAARVSGGWNDLSAPIVFEVPVSRLVDGPYVIPALLGFTGTKTIAWSAKVRSYDGVTVTDVTPGSDEARSGTVVLTNSGTAAWRIHPIARLNLPMVKVEDPVATLVVEVTLSMASGGSTVQFDEGWILADDDKTAAGATTALYLADGVVQQLEVRAPSIANYARAGVFGATDAGTQDLGRFADLSGAHTMWPGLAYILTVSDRLGYASCEVEYFRSYHSHPGPDLPLELEVG